MGLSSLLPDEEVFVGIPVERFQRSTISSPARNAPGMGVFSDDDGRRHPRSNPLGLGRPRGHLLDLLKGPKSLEQVHKRPTAGVEIPLRRDGDHRLHPHSPSEWGYLRLQVVEAERLGQPLGLPRLGDRQDNERPERPLGGLRDAGLQEEALGLLELGGRQAQVDTTIVLHNHGQFVFCTRDFQSRGLDGVFAFALFSTNAADRLGHLGEILLPKDDGQSAIVGHLTDDSIVGQRNLLHRRQELTQKFNKPQRKLRAEVADGQSIRERDKYTRSFLFHFVLLVPLQISFRFIGGTTCSEKI